MRSFVACLLVASVCSVPLTTNPSLGSDVDMVGQMLSFVVGLVHPDRDAVHNAIASGTEMLKAVEKTLEVVDRATPATTATDAFVNTDGSINLVNTASAFTDVLTSLVPPSHPLSPQEKKQLDDIIASFIRPLQKTVDEMMIELAPPVEAHEGEQVLLGEEATASTVSVEKVAMKFIERMEKDLRATM
eukprot:c1740_g1_i1.p1 GENE.c1740_g1_i1~~c1740_g1_i1.p1  ORF type:complete len:202 (+),score=65.71 c1740_g1_i1:43-606(+)